jgi:hypothetical protein
MHVCLTACTRHDQVVVVSVSVRASPAGRRKPMTQTVRFGPFVSGPCVAVQPAWPARAAARRILSDFVQPLAGNGLHFGDASHAAISKLYRRSK